MGGILRTVREACFCCEGTNKCCKLDSSEGITFDPDEGWTLESLEVTNLNAYGCVGRARLDITVSKPGNPALSCPSTNLGCGAFCGSGFGGNLPGGSASAAIAIFDEWLSGYTPPAGWTYNGFGSDGYVYPVNTGYWTCSRMEWQLWGGTLYCPGPCATGSGTRAMFTYDDYQCYATVTERTNAMNAISAAFESDFSAWVAANPVIEFQVGSCMYRLDLSIGPTYPALTRTSCMQNLTSGANRYCYCRIFSRYVPTIRWTKKCTASPCAGIDAYDWPLSLDCTCTGEYDPPEGSPATTPACELELTDSSGPDWSDDKCYFSATFEGLVASGTVDCGSTPDADHCICCGEGGT